MVEDRNHTLEDQNDHVLNYSVGYDQLNQLSCLIQNDRVVIKSSVNNNNMVKIHSLLDCMAHDQEYKLANEIDASCPYIMFYFGNAITLLTVKVKYKTLHLNLYYLDTKARFASLFKVPFSNYLISDSLFDLRNCIAVSHRDDGVIVVSILNDQVFRNHRIVFHIFHQKAHGRNWKTSSSLLPIQYKCNVNYQIKSCKIDTASRYMYCSLLLDGVGVYIYQFDVMSLLQPQRSYSIKPVCNWHIAELTFQNCFLSSLQVIICCNIIYGKNIIKIKRPVNFLPALPADYTFEFSSKVTIIEASIVSNSQMIVMYHNNITKQCFLKIISI